MKTYDVYAIREGMDRENPDVYLGCCCAECDYLAIADVWLRYTMFNYDKLRNGQKFIKLMAIEFGYSIDCAFYINLK